MSGEIIHWAKIRESSLSELQQDTELMLLGLLVSVIAEPNQTIEIKGMRDSKIRTHDGEVVVKVIKGDIRAIQAFYDWVDSVSK
jgi:hypothetical protein